MPRKAKNKPRDSFVFYRSFYEAAHCLSNEQKGELMETICDYALNGELKDHGSEVIKGMMVIIKPLLDSNYRKYLNGCKGGAPKGNKNAKGKTLRETKTITTETTTEEIDNEKEISIEIEETKGEA